MIFKIHDLPIKYPMEGMSFHVSRTPLERLWWDGESLSLVLVTGEVWTHDFEADQWEHTETIGTDYVPPFTREDVELVRIASGEVSDGYRRLQALADRLEAHLPPEATG